MTLSHQERGRIGHRAAIEENPDHRREAGKKAIGALASRSSSGSIDDAMSWPRSRQPEYAIETLVAQKHAAMLANGREIGCEELPVLLEPDGGPMFGRDIIGRQAQGRGRAG